MIEHLATLRSYPVFTTTRIILARNPAYYTAKKYLLRARGNGLAPRYALHRDWSALARFYPIDAMSFAAALRLDWQLVRRGMPPSSMPSTGMIAYDWHCRRLNPWDYLFVEGFTFEGWSLHPWEIEQQVIRPIDEARARPLGPDFKPRRHWPHTA